MKASRRISECRGRYERSASFDAPRPILFLAFLFSCFPALASAASAGPPNVILVMCDDLGWGDVGYNGHKHLKTPHLDAMAANGLRFDRFYAGAPVCSPTRGSALTGRHPYRYGIPFANTGKMKPQELTLAEALKQRGYTTGHFGKWHLGTLTTKIKDANRGKPGETKHFSPPWVNGFDVCFSTESKVPTWDPMLRPKGNNSRTWWDAVPGDADPDTVATHYGTHYWSNGKLVTDNLRGANSRVIMDRAIPFIEGAVRDKKPFFAVVWFHTPHLPVVAGPKYAAMYAKHDKHTQHYYGCITAMDEQVGRLRAKLRELGVADNTMLWFCSDNGPEGNDKAPGRTGGLRGRKRSLFEGGVRVPGLLEWPAMVKTARTTRVPAVTSDYMPTVLDAIGLKPKQVVSPIDGISLLPLIKGDMKERPARIGFESRGTATLVGNRYKLVLPSGRNAKPMLFDLIADRGEENDIAGKEPKVVAALMKELSAWRASCKASAAEEDYREVAHPSQ